MNMHCYIHTHFLFVLKICPCKEHTLYFIQFMQYICMWPWILGALVVPLLHVTSCFFFWLFYFPFQAIKLWKKTCARLDGGAAGRLLTKYLNCLEMWKYLSRIMTILERALDQRCFRSCKILPRKHNLKVEMVTVVYCGWVRVNQLMLFFNGSSKQRVVFNLPLTTLLAGFVRSWVLHLLHLQQQDYSHHREFVSLVQMLPV